MTHFNQLSYLSPCFIFIKVPSLLSIVSRMEKAKVETPRDKGGTLSKAPFTYTETLLPNIRESQIF